VATTYYLINRVVSSLSITFWCLYYRIALNDIIHARTAREYEQNVFVSTKTITFNVNIQLRIFSKAAAQEVMHHPKAGALNSKRQRT
jgi:hypothetical protein